MAEVVLTDEERQTLQRWARRAKSSQALAQRCRIVLGCAAGKSNKEVAVELGIWPQTVGKWRNRFVARGMEGLVDEPRPGGPRTITDEQVEVVLVATLERQPADATHYRSRLSNATSAIGSPSGTRTRNRSPGPRPQTRSSNDSPHIFNEFPARDTRSLTHAGADKGGL
ncbi:helix-turn-helix domain-containing protein [Nocardia sp. R6R-6]|uniref:helix-turn-helix domain-containing protein n=1 Tax=Nocardia sp. R6R-6 TaxID=3459303 RepID=UPI00403DAFD2